jgi:hypothetical protein
MMLKGKGIRLSLVLVGSLFAVLSGCSSGSNSSDPRQVVISFFGAMEKNDQAALAHMLDLPSLMKNMAEDYAVQTDSPRVFTNPQDILIDLTNTGLTKTRWFSLQRVVANSQVNEDNAIVEVTFVDKQASRGYRTHFGLHKMNDVWKIYSFMTFEGAK